jgi:predicted DNA binding CopG/RHH family protein
MPRGRIEEDEKKIPVGANIKAKYVKRLKEIASNMGIPYARLIESIVESYLKKYEKNVKKTKKLEK